MGFLDEHFNSHAHVERDEQAGYTVASASISTHTLTWSVTIDRVAFGAETAISTHTLTWSVTDINAVTLAYNTISTHTLTWSVTLTL